MRVSKWLRPGICERPRRVRGVDAVRETHTVRCPQGALKGRSRCAGACEDVEFRPISKPPAPPSHSHRIADSPCRVLYWVVLGAPWRFPGRSLRLENSATLRRCGRWRWHARERGNASGEDTHRLINPPRIGRVGIRAVSARPSTSPSHPLQHGPSLTAFRPQAASR